MAESAEAFKASGRRKPDSGARSSGSSASDTWKNLDDANSRDFDVVVVGYGPAGAACANFLGLHSVRTLVVDRFSDVIVQPRAIALDNDALRILQGAGLAEGDFGTVAIPRVEMHSPIWGRYNRINTLGSSNGHPRLVTFYQPDLERALRARAAEHASVVSALGGVELTGLRQTEDWVVAELSTPDGPREVRCRYLIGADGANSTVRKLVGLDFVGKSFDEDWLIVDAIGAPTKIDHIEFHCDPKRPAPHMVAPDGRERWEFMLRPGEAEQLEREPHRIDALLAPWRQPGTPLEIERKVVYRFQAKVAPSFDQGRVFLVGDAAHVTPPFVGQGLVSGLRDAANLAWKLAWVVKQRADRSILDSYTTERRPHAIAMVRLARLMGGLVTPRSWLQAFLLHGAVRGLLSALGLGRRGVDPEMVKPNNRLPSGLFAPCSQASGRLPGDQLPQVWLRNDSGELRLSDDVLGPHLCVLGFGVDPADFVDARDLPAMDARLIQVRHRGQALHLAPVTPSWEDVSGDLFPKVAPFGWIVVVRPDRTILHAGPASEAARIMKDVAAIMRPPI